MTAAILLAFVVIFGVALAATLVYIVRLLGLLQEALGAKHAHPRFGLLKDTPADGFEVKRHDGVIRVGAHERNVQRRQTEDRPPWTGGQHVLDEAAEQARVDLVRSQLPEHAEDVTREDMVRALAGLRALPAGSAEPQVTS